MGNLIPWRKPKQKPKLDPATEAELMMLAGRINKSHHEERLHDAERVRTVQYDAQGRVVGSTETTYERMFEASADDWLE